MSAVRAGQSAVALGVSTVEAVTASPYRLEPWRDLAINAVLAAVVRTTTLRNLGGSYLLRWRASLLGFAAAAAAVIAGTSLLLDVGGGLYWLVAELAAGIVVAVCHGWTLLIEIRR